MMGLLLPVFQLLYVVSHFLCSLALSVVDTFQELQGWVWRVRDRVQGQGRGISWWQLGQDAGQLKKVPHHLGLVCVGRHGSQVGQLGAIVGWAAGYGVRHVSLYDPRGAIKARCRELQDVLAGVEGQGCAYTFPQGQCAPTGHAHGHVHECSHGCVHDLSQSCTHDHSHTLGHAHSHSHTHDHSSGAGQPTSYQTVTQHCTNHKPARQTSTDQQLASESSIEAEVRSQPRVAVHLLSLEDGRASLAKAAASMSTTDTTPDKDNIAVRLGRAHWPDPEMVVVVGAPVTTLGYPPWHTRLTEFFPLTRPDYPAFKEAMTLFSRVDQRVGK